MKLQNYFTYRSKYIDNMMSVVAQFIFQVISQVSVPMDNYWRGFPGEKKYKNRFSDNKNSIIDILFKTVCKIILKFPRLCPCGPLLVGVTVQITSKTNSATLKTL